MNNINENGYDFSFISNLNNESVGSPIINLKNNKIFGINKSYDKTNNLNFGILLKFPMLDFYKQNITPMLNNSEIGELILTYSFDAFSLGSGLLNIC